MLTIQSETYTNGTCGSPGSGGAYTTATVDHRHDQPGDREWLLLPATRSPAPTTSATRRRVSTTVKVDTTAPERADGDALLGDRQHVRQRHHRVHQPAERQVRQLRRDRQRHRRRVRHRDDQTALAERVHERRRHAQLAVQNDLRMVGLLGRRRGGRPERHRDQRRRPDRSEQLRVHGRRRHHGPDGRLGQRARQGERLRVPVTFAAGTDAGSGVSSSLDEILRAEATYTASTDTCGSFGSFTETRGAERLALLGLDRREHQVLRVRVHAPPTTSATRRPTVRPAPSSRDRKRCRSRPSTAQARKRRWTPKT